MVIFVFSCVKQKQKLQGDSGAGEDIPVAPQEPKVVRKFPQNKTVKHIAAESKSRLSKDILAGVSVGFPICENGKSFIFELSSKKFCPIVLLIGVWRSVMREKAPSTVWSLIPQFCFWFLT